MGNSLMPRHFDAAAFKRIAREHLAFDTAYYEKLAAAVPDEDDVDRQLAEALQRLRLRRKPPLEKRHG